MGGGQAEEWVGAGWVDRWGMFGPVLSAQGQACKHFQGWVGKAGSETGEARGGPGAEPGVPLKACYVSPDLQILQENLGNFKT